MVRQQNDQIFVDITENDICKIYYGVRDNWPKKKDSNFSQTFYAVEKFDFELFELAI